MSIQPRWMKEILAASAEEAHVMPWQKAKRPALRPELLGTPVEPARTATPA